MSSITDQLCDFGYPREKAEAAYKKGGDDLGRCLDLLDQDDGLDDIIVDENPSTAPFYDPYELPSNPSMNSASQYTNAIASGSNGEYIPYQTEVPGTDWQNGDAGEWAEVSRNKARITTTPTRTTAVVAKRKDNATSRYFDSERNRTTIDLTEDDDDTVPPPLMIADAPYYKDDQGDEMERALAASVATSTLTHTEGSTDADLQRAIDASLAGEVDRDPKQWDAIESLKSPAERIRSENTPVILRSTSSAFTPVAAYIQALFAIPFFRNKILEHTPTEYASNGNQIGSQRSYEGYWKDESLTPPARVLEDKKIIALQRLFTFMVLTRRSFCHIGEITNVLQCREQEFIGQATAARIGSIHQDLVNTLCAAELPYRQIGSANMSEDEEVTQCFAISRQYLTFGQMLPYDDRFCRPLAPLTSVEINSGTSMFTLDVISNGLESDDLHSAIARMLVQPDNPRSISVIRCLPPVLTFKVDRTPSATPLAGSKSNERQIFKILPELYLDRYLASNRRAYVDARKRMAEIDERMEQVREKRRALVVIPKAAGGESDAVEQLTNAIAYFNDATTEDSARRARQIKLEKQYQVLLLKLKSKLAEYDAELERLALEHDEPFNCAAMQQSGRYELNSMVFRTGLMGRESNWSVVKGDDGRWWRIVGLEIIEVSLEAVLLDQSGIWTDAGAYMLFYSLANEDPAKPRCPAALYEAVNVDNHNFGLEVPLESSNWNLPPINHDFATFSLPNSSVYDLPFPLPPLPPPRHHTSMALDSHRATSHESDPDWARQRHPVASTSSSNNPFRYTAPDSGVPFERVDLDSVDEPVDETADILLDDGGSADEVMRIRGGATVDDDEDDGDGLDEDEVELGCLRKISSAWDVDLSVGKVGGLPKWIDPSSPLSYSELTCGVCSKIMVLLLQMNSPDDDQPHAAARTLYLFACRGKECLSKNSVKSLKLFRTQMPSPNNYYPHTVESQAKRLAIESTLGVSQLGGARPVDRLETTPFPELEIFCEVEPYQESYLDQPDEAVNEEHEPTDSEDANEKDTKFDKPFLVFQERLHRLPEQVLRFYRLPGVLDPQPLWISNDRVDPDSTQRCELCGGHRALEFQILSTLLTHLEDYDFEFDSLLIYTCVANCIIPIREEGRSGWKDEVVVALQFGSLGAKLGRA